MNRWIPSWATDAALGIGLFVLSILSLLQYQATDVAAVHQRTPSVLSYALIALQTLPLIWRRRFPVAVVLVVLAAWMLDRGLDYPSSLAGIGTLVALHAVGSQLSSRKSMIWGLSVIGVVVAFTLLGSVLYESVALVNVVGEVLTGLLALYLGREVNERQTERSRLQEQVERAEREREERALAAVAAERGRIARELHDVVAHQIVVMTVQAEGAARLATDADPRVRDALGTISAAGREGLGEMRRMVGLLREPADAEPMAPQPGLAEIDRLTGHFADAGLPVSVKVLGQPRRLPGGIDINAYRIVQESLTNSLKHGGPGVKANLTLDYGQDRLGISVLDDGRGVVGPLAPGHGLVGMHERVSLLAGELHTGARPGGGFAVQATIPVPA